MQNVPSDFESYEAITLNAPRGPDLIAIVSLPFFLGFHTEGLWLHKFHPQTLAGRKTSFYIGFAGSGVEKETCFQMETGMWDCNGKIVPGPIQFQMFWRFIVLWFCKFCQTVIGLLGFGGSQSLLGALWRDKGSRRCCFWRWDADSPHWSLTVPGYNICSWARQEVVAGKEAVPQATVACRLYCS